MFKFYLVKGNTKFQLPVPPAAITVTAGNNTQTVDIYNLGEINLKGKPKLSGISFSTFFPSVYYAFCQYKNIKGALWSAELIDNWRKAGEPIKIIITGTNINMAATIENFTYGWKHGTKDIDFTLELKEYRYLESKNSNYYITTTYKYSVANKNTKYVRPSNKPSAKPTSYVVKQGDTLAIISKKIYGTTTKWRDIANKNNIKNPLKIKVGQKLVL